MHKTLRAQRICLDKFLQKSLLNKEANELSPLIYQIENPVGIGTIAIKPVAGFHWA
jgi:hypothetical protein